MGLFNSNADYIIYNGVVITVNKEDEIAQAVVIQDDRILYVGSDKKAMAYAGSHTYMIDAGGKTVMPGFIDAHIHLGLQGLLEDSVIDVSYPNVKNIEEILDLVRQDAAKRGPGEWIKLSGYDHNKLAEQRHPTREELDSAAPDNPVQLVRCCAHMGVYNSLALETVGIDRNSSYAPGEVEFNEDGSLHGLLRETAHQNASKKVIYTDEELLNAQKNTNRLLLSLGVTSAHDAGAYGKDSTKAMQDGAALIENSPHINMMIFELFGKESLKQYLDAFIATGLHSGIGNNSFRIGPVKIMLDGSSSGPSSAMIEGYSHDPDNHGILVWSQEEVDEIVMRAHRAGFQMTAHAVGDKAVTIMVNAIEKAQRAYPRKDPRHRIEHCGFADPEMVKRIAELGIIPVSNPSFITINGTDYNRYYGDRVKNMFPLRSYLDGGVITAIGSDAPITYPDPMNSLYGALNRKDQATKDDVGPEQKVSMLEVIRMFTYNGAYASFEENIKGSLEEGKLADIILLDKNILEVPAEEIQSVRVTHTFVNGKLMYVHLPS